MHPFPHRYSVSAAVGPDGPVRLDSQRLASLYTGLPAEFGGTGDRWSPETLFVAAVADCYAMTFRGIAAASKLPWISFTCDVDGILDRMDGVTSFTTINVHAHLTTPESASRDQALRILSRAEETCLVTRSLTARVHLDAHVETVSTALESSLALG